MASTSEDLERYDIPQLVIHGNATRAKQFGYTNPYPDISKGEQAIPDEIVDYVAAVYGEGVRVSSHAYGNPGFCMHLTLSNFVRNTTGVSVDVENAYLLQFPYTDYPGNSWNYSPSPSVLSPPEPRVGYNLSPAAYRRFPCPFTVYLQFLDVKSNGTVSKLGNPINLFSKDSTAYWTEGQFGVQGKTIGGPWKVDRDDMVIVTVIMNASCSCNQTGVDLPVFAANITQYIPPVSPYIWRKFGTNKTNDPDGYAINPDKLDGKWHLVRPFYFQGKDKKWHDVEEDFNND